MKLKISSILIALFSLLLVGGSANAADDPMFEILGKYQRINPPIPTRSGDKIEVIELFWYGCPHCFHFEPHMRNWLAKKPEHVSFERIPAIFRDSWMQHARAFYAAQEMGVFDQVHHALFDGIHNKKQKINTREQIAALITSLGIDEKTFLSYFDSFGIESRARQAKQLTRKYGIKGVPAIIINGKYRTSGTLAGSFESMVKVIEILVDEEYKSSAGTSSTTDGNQ